MIDTKFFFCFSGRMHLSQVPTDRKSVVYSCVLESVPMVPNANSSIMMHNLKHQGIDCYNEIYLLKSVCYSYVCFLILKTSTGIEKIVELTDKFVMCICEKILLFIMHIV